MLCPHSLPFQLFSVCYLLVMIASVALMVQLRPAQKPPQLFKSDTNLQRLLDLAANFSHSDIHCDDCSGFYKVRRTHDMVQINQKYPD